MTIRERFELRPVDGSNSVPSGIVTPALHVETRLTACGVIACRLERVDVRKFGSEIRREKRVPFPHNSATIAVAFT